MLDVQTRRRIDTARDILVGKVPDPTSQVEQITIALMFKFMDDMDGMSEGYGGTASFFVGEFKKYSWRRILGPRVSAHETLYLYDEGIEKMKENPDVPPLFRQIFRNASLPFRDPETLKTFLGVIDEFSYEDPEALGDAYEYLLSAMRAQGNAGQFRTPRHIIDFVVSLIDPKKNETILDPACGSAGFLVSAFNHILKSNTKPEGTTQLTMDERANLANNIRGYDIDPKWVRVALVNLYLHEFPEPMIFEYDTLTSEERWSEHANVIVANPPFMTPKGGIKPHNRFSVKSKRSEVLFVDYIAEHLTSDGRAGIIVPEGVISRSQNAYRQLRKLLVNEYLVAVISLPSGVFNPYSGVKTSILILDRSLARWSDTVGFFKVNNDGFDLGAQRRPIDQDDLPAVVAEVVEYLRRVRQGDGIEEYAPEHGLVVEKERLGGDGEFNLSGERYNDSVAVVSKYPYVPLESLFQRSRQTVSPATLNESVKYIGLENLESQTGRLIGEIIADDPTNIKSSKNVFSSGDILYGKLRPKLNKVWFADSDGICSSDIYVIQPNNGEAVPEFYEHVFRSKQFNDEALKRLSGAQLPRINWQSLGSIEVPHPPLEVQREVVSEIEGYRKVIDGARAVVENWRPRIAVDPEWPVVELGEVTKPEYGFTAAAQDHGNARFIRITDISEDGDLNSDNPKFITMSDDAMKSLLAQGDILVARTGATYGKTMLFEGNDASVFASYLIRLRFPREKIDPRYYWAFAQSKDYWQQARALVTGGGQPQFNGNALKRVRLPVPSLSEQQAIGIDIETEQELVDANRRLIERMEGKVREVVERVWGD